MIFVFVCFLVLLFVQIYRDYIHAQKSNTAGTFLEDVYPAILSVMASTEKYDTDGDGMIENSGFPDQTYDIWTARGIHAYCGGLWIAACEAAASICTVMDDPSTAQHYKNKAVKARASYISALWNGKYLNYDSSDQSHHDSIMADMMAGHWYARACGLPPVLPLEKARSCFDVIFKMNVLAFGDGKLGAVNGMRPNGTQDTSNMQIREVWTGTTYALAAAMLQEAAVYERVSTSGGTLSSPDHDKKVGGGSPSSPQSSLELSAIELSLESATTAATTSASELDSPQELSGGGPTAAAAAESGGVTAAEAAQVALDLRFMAFKTAQVLLYY